MMPHIRWLPLFVLAPAILEACGECSDCDRGPIPVAYVQVRTVTLAGGLAGIAVRLERQGFVPLSAATDAVGEHTFEALEAADGEQVTLIVTPPTGYVTPSPRVLSLVLNDTVNSQVMLESTP